MIYTSTRGKAPDLGFDDVLLTGLARDGGLYVPREWPRLDEADLSALVGVPYAEAALRVMRPFLGDSLTVDELQPLIRQTYARFAHPAIAPLVQIDHRLWLMELFHGPTIAFKDYALQLLGRLFDRVLARRGHRVTVVGATSGDTGSAAIEAFRDRDNIDIFILHPHGRVSDVQRRQMTTVPAGNVFNIAVEGSFDDCQDLVKGMFNDPAFRDEFSLAAVNSINWARVMAQIVYYVTAAVALGAPGRRVTFSVPSGNFGNVYAAYAARQMGLPIARLLVGANRNDILDRFFRTGTLRSEPVVPTLSPSMDIQISSNLERLLFDLFDRDGGRVSAAMQRFRDTGHSAVSSQEIARAQDVFASHRLDDDGILATIADVYRTTGMVIDPHTAVGVAAAQSEHDRGDGPIVALACAHPAKFPDAVERAIGRRPDLPEHLSDLMDRRERFDVLAPDLSVVQDHVRSRVRRGGVAA